MSFASSAIVYFSQTIWGSRPKLLTVLAVIGPMQAIIDLFLWTNSFPMISKKSLAVEELAKVMTSIPPDFMSSFAGSRV